MNELESTNERAGETNMPFMPCSQPTTSPELVGLVTVIGQMTRYAQDNCLRRDYASSCLLGACAILFDDSMTIRNTFIYKIGIYFKWKMMTKHESNTQNKRCQLYYREYWKETTRVLCNKTCWIVESSYWRIRELFLLDRQLTAFFFFLGLLLGKANVYTVQFVGCLV